jgi:hypothetical protein
MDYKKIIAKEFVVVSYYAGCYITPLVLIVIALDNALQSAPPLVKMVSSFLLGVVWGLWLSLATKILSTVLEE